MSEVVELSPSEGLGEKYKRHAIGLSGLAKILDTEPPIVHPGRDFIKKYDRVGKALFSKFTRLTPEQQFLNGGVAHGFLVAARLAMWGVRAYEGFTAQSGTKATVNELAAILSQSYRPAVTTFSSVNNETNRTLETDFGLRSDLSPAYEPLPFAILPDDKTGLLVLTPSAHSLELSMRKATEFITWTNTPSMGRCPASGAMLKKVWELTIQTCVVNEEFFPYDVAQINKTA